MKFKTSALFVFISIISLGAFSQDLTLMLPSQLQPVLNEYELVEKTVVDENIIAWGFLKNRESLIVYDINNGQYFISGNMMNANLKSLTNQHKQSLEKFIPDVSAEFMKLALSNSYGLPYSTSSNAKLDFYIFHDPSCGYCKRLMNLLYGKSSNSINIYIVPVSVISRESHDISAQLIANGKNSVEGGLQDLFQYLNDYSQLPINASDVERNSGQLSQNNDLFSKSGAEGTPSIVIVDRSNPDSIRYELLKSVFSPANLTRLEMHLQ